MRLSITWKTLPGARHPTDSGADRTRTDDIQLAKLALSQLSYGPKERGMAQERIYLKSPRKDDQNKSSAGADPSSLAEGLPLPLILPDRFREVEMGERAQPLLLFFFFFFPGDFLPGDFLTGDFLPTAFLSNSVRRSLSTARSAA